METPRICDEEVGSNMTTHKFSSTAEEKGSDSVTFEWSDNTPRSQTHQQVSLQPYRRGKNCETSSPQHANDANVFPTDPKYEKTTSTWCSSQADEYSAIRERHNMRTSSSNASLNEERVSDATRRQGQRQQRYRNETGNTRKGSTKTKKHCEGGRLVSLSCSRQTRKVDIFILILMLVSLLTGTFLFRSEVQAAGDKFTSDLTSQCRFISNNAMQIFSLVQTAQDTLISGMGTFVKAQDSNELQFREFQERTKNIRIDGAPVNNLRSLLPYASFFQRVLREDRAAFELQLGRENNRPYINFTVLNRTVSSNAVYSIAPEADEYMVLRFADRFGFYGLNLLPEPCHGASFRQAIETGRRYTSPNSIAHDPTLFYMSSAPVYVDPNDVYIPGSGNAVVASLVNISQLWESAFNSLLPSMDLVEGIEVRSERHMYAPSCPFFFEVLYQSEGYADLDIVEAVSTRALIGDYNYPLICSSTKFSGTPFYAWFILITSIVLGIAICFLVKLVANRADLFQMTIDKRVEELEEAKDEQRGLRQDIESILAAVWDPMIAFNGEGQVVRVNNAAISLSGYSRSDLILMDPMKLFFVDRSSPRLFSSKDGQGGDSESDQVEDKPVENVSRSGSQNSRSWKYNGHFMAVNVDDAPRGKGFEEDSRHFFADSHKGEYSPGSNVDMELSSPDGLPLQNSQRHRHRRQQIEEFISSLDSDAHNSYFITFSGESVNVEVTVGRSSLSREAVYVVTFRDVTERIKYEKLLQEAKSSADIANKNKGDFVAFICHELRNPLHAIVGISDLLCDTQLNMEQRDMVSSVIHSSKLMNTIVDDVLDLSKIGQHRMELEVTPFNLPHLVKMIDQNSAMVSKVKNVRWRVEVDNGLPEIVQGDPTRLQQILVNLVSNAIKFTSDGCITLRVTLLHTYQDGEGHSICEVVFEVEDTGIGILKENIPRLFETYSQANQQICRQFGGTGLGLSLVKNLVDKMSGRVEVKSQIGKGSTFSIFLPFEIASPLLDLSDVANGSSRSHARIYDQLQYRGGYNQSPVKQPNSPIANDGGENLKRDESEEEKDIGGKPPDATTTSSAPSPALDTHTPSPITIHESISQDPFIRVLLVEDNLVNRKLGLRMLSKMDGVAADAAVDGVDCLEVVSSHPLNYYSLVLMDVCSLLILFLVDCLRFECRLLFVVRSLSLSPPPPASLTPALFCTTAANAPYGWHRRCSKPARDGLQEQIGGSYCKCDSGG